MHAFATPTRTPRHRVSLFVGSNTDGTSPFGRARDLSLTGIFLETGTRPEVGATRELVFIWGEDTLTVHARVVRQNHDGIAMTFVSPDPDFLRVIQEILESSPAIDLVQ